MGADEKYPHTASPFNVACACPCAGLALSLRCPSLQAACKQSRRAVNCSLLDMLRQTHLISKAASKGKLLISWIVQKGRSLGAIENDAVPLDLCKSEETVRI